jgi:hypothetical protein
MLKMDLLNVISHNVAVYKNVSTLNKVLLHISRQKCRLLIKHILIPERVIANAIIIIGGGGGGDENCHQKLEGPRFETLSISN